MLTLSTPINRIPGIGSFYVKKLHKMGIKTIYDLIFYFPYKYEDFSNIIPIKKIKINEICSIQGKIIEINNNWTWKKKINITQALIKDKSGTCRAVWFNQPYLIKNLKRNDRVSLSGKVLMGKEGIYLNNPIYEKITGNSENLIHTSRIVPVYLETAGLSSRWLRRILKPLLMRIKDKIPDTIPKKIREENKLIDFSKAIVQIHFPDLLKLAQLAKKRFSFEELFLIELYVLREKIKISQLPAIPIPINLKIIRKFIKSLSFKLTNDQKKAAWQILNDLAKPSPASRLLQGDVGSGKTVVAAIAILNTVKAGYQVALMAPTEILSKQHFKTFASLFSQFHLNIGLLTGKEDKFISEKLPNEVIEISRKKLLEKTAQGEINFLIGTQTLIQKEIRFKNLAFVIIDEQHRFGVEQRAKLARPNSNYKNRSKIKIPHFLSMTATPIPRSLALTIYGDLDLSLIKELPEGRKKVITKIIAPQEKEKVYSFIKKEIKKGRQAFVVCPRIEPRTNKNKKDNGWAEVRAVKEEFEKLSKDIFPHFKIAMLHGQMTSTEKEKIMREFKDQKIDILVSTSVIEEGIDIPNATVMMIEGADRFGLSQLYQFRGRVGRSKYQSYCFLLTDSPSKKTKLRLRALSKYNDSFNLAKKDLEIRGPGELSGKRQWGIPDLAMSSLNDIFLIEKTRNSAKEILEENVDLKDYPLLRQRLNLFEKNIHLE